MLMNDYMIALQKWFLVVSQRTNRARQAVQSAYDELHAELDESQKQMLLGLYDAYAIYREEKALDSFITGFRLADGIRTELAAIPPYSFEQESGDLARDAFDQERL